jgi:hypothetical protein
MVYYREIQSIMSVSVKVENETYDLDGHRRIMVIRILYCLGPLCKYK